MRVEQLMSRPAITCHVNDTLHAAAHLMWQCDCGFLPVVNDEGVLTGVITDRDICMAGYTQGLALQALLVNSAMARHVVAVHVDATVAELERLMADHRVRRVPVVDGSRRPIGVVSLDDLAREAVQPDSREEHGAQKLAHTLAAICRPHLRRDANP